jgi:hypothetical protein
MTFSFEPPGQVAQARFDLDRLGKYLRRAARRNVTDFGGEGRQMGVSHDRHQWQP